jgi:hypothetical protein
VNGKVRDFSPWIPDGTYTVQFTHYETSKSWNGCKVHAHFAVVEGEHAGVPLTRYYNVNALIGQPGINGEFEAPFRGHLVREYSALLPDVASLGAVDLNAYRDIRIKAEVSTVNSDGLGHALTDMNRYSRIRRLLEIVDDPETRVGKEEVG